MADDGQLTVGGLTLKVTNPDRVLYPATGTSKAEVLDYYAAVAGAMLPHLDGRPATRKRWRNGTGGPAFFVKDLEPGAPSWLDVAQIPHARRTVFYPLLHTAAALVWLGQVAALEVHVPQWRLQPTGPARPPTTARPPRYPDRVVFDLDPGPGATLADCAAVAFELRDRLGDLGGRCVPVTSGSKGLHVYVPIDDPLPSAQAAAWARLAAEQLEQAMPDLVVSRMTKALRTGKVLIDWSQNNARKTTIAPYSLRGRSAPTVAAPRTWDELSNPRLQQLTHHEVLERLAAGCDPLTALICPPARTPALEPAVGAHYAHNTGRAAVRLRAVPASQPLSGPPRPRKRPAGVNLPLDLTGGVTVALARAQDRIPSADALPGGVRLEPKWDGFRLTAASRPDNHVVLRSRQNTDLTDRFPEIADALRRTLPPATVVDGEVVVFHNDRLDFDLLQQRLVNRPNRIRQLAGQNPASYVVFDVLAVRGEDLRRRPWTERRHHLEQLLDWIPPLQLTPYTDDPDVARTWMTAWAPLGVEGLVAKGAASPYRPGHRAWIKIKFRATTEVTVGAVLGPIDRPDSVVAGLYRGDRLVVVGRSSQLTAGQSRALGAVLTAPTGEHPWPDHIQAHAFGRSHQVPLTKVDPVIVVEVAADTARSSTGAWRHPLRYLRVRLDLSVSDLPLLPTRETRP